MTERAVQLTKLEQQELRIYREYAEDRTRTEAERDNARRKIEEILGRGLEGRLRKLEARVAVLEREVGAFLEKRESSAGNVSAAATDKIGAADKAEAKTTGEPNKGKPPTARTAGKPKAPKQSTQKPPADSIEF